MTPAWRTLKLSSETPRSEKLLDDLDLQSGLRNWKVVGWLAWVGVLMALSSLLITGEVVLKLLCAMVLAGIAIGFQRHARQQFALRKRALLEGIVVTGSVVRHGKRLTPFSSRSHVTITALFWLTDKEQTATGILWRREALKMVPKGRQLLGLWLPDSNQIWLPLELGLRLDAEPLLPPDKILDDMPDKV